MDQPDGLISVLVDEFADEASRDDAAMDLSMFNESSVEDALIRVASSLQTSDILCASCGESLAEIWERKSKFNRMAYQGLRPAAKSEIETYFNEVHTTQLRS